MDNKVYVIRCGDYAQAEEKLSELIAKMGGMSRFARSGERLALKVNLLEAAAPERAVTTHPAVTAAVAALTVCAGAKAVILDSPGGGLRQQNESMLKRLYHITGMDEAAAHSGAELNFDMSCEERPCPEGKLVRNFEVLSAAFRADGVLNLCKMKTHMFMGMTGGVKNNFGVIPGLGKMGCHTRFQDKLQFADMLLDLTALVNPRLTVMDAVLAMEGEGPGTSGTPRQVGLLLAAENPLALDVVAGEIMGLSKADNPLLLAAERRGLFPTALEDVELIGMEKSELRISGYRIPAGVKKDMTGIPAALRPLAALARRSLSAAPWVTQRCVGCGVCAASCPVHAITMAGEAHSGKALIDDKRCIHCYCCHELCPHAAIDLRAGVLAKLLRH